MPIVSVRAEPISGRVRPDIAIISSLGQHLAGQYVLVRVADDAGRVGLGEASVTAVWSGETQAGAVALIREVLAPLVVGADPFDSEWITPSAPSSTTSTRAAWTKTSSSSSPASSGARRRSTAAPDAITMLRFRRWPWRAAV